MASKNIYSFFSFFKNFSITRSASKADKEAVELNVFGFPYSTSAVANRDEVLANQGFNMGWRNVSLEKLSANMYNSRKACLLNILSVFILDDCVCGNQFTKVVHM